MLKLHRLVVLLSTLTLMSSTKAFLAPGRPSSFSTETRESGVAFIRLQAAFERSFEVTIQTQCGYQLGGNDTATSLTPASLLAHWEPMAVTQQPVDPKTKVNQLE